MPVYELCRKLSWIEYYRVEADSEDAAIAQLTAAEPEGDLDQYNQGESNLLLGPFELDQGQYHEYDE